MLLTTCPACNARFKVQSAQLNVRQGRVMCGRCRNVFNAFETLEREESPTPVVDSESSHAPPTIGTAAHAPDPATPAAGAMAHAQSGFIPVTIETMPLPPAHTVDADMDTLLEPLHEPATGTHTTAGPKQPADDTRVGLNGADASEQKIIPDENGAATARAVQDTVPALGSVAIEKQVPNVPRPPENPLLNAATHHASREPSRAWSWAAVLAGLALSLQVLYLVRSPLSEKYPQLRPPLSALCDRLGCTIPWQRDEAAIEITDSSLIEVPGKPGRILLTATLTNRSNLKQEYPTLKLDLTDNNNQAVMRRLIAPADYVGRALNRDDGINASGELYVNLSLDIGTKSRASGYGLKPLYP